MKGRQSPQIAIWTSSSSGLQTSAMLRREEGDRRRSDEDTDVELVEINGVANSGFISDEISSESRLGVINEEYNEEPLRVVNRPPLNPDIDLPSSSTELCHDNNVTRKIDIGDNMELKGITHSMHNSLTGYGSLSNSERMNVNHASIYKESYDNQNTCDDTSNSDNEINEHDVISKHDIDQPYKDPSQIIISVEGNIAPSTNMADVNRILNAKLQTCDGLKWQRVQTRMSRRIIADLDTIDSIGNEDKNPVQDSGLIEKRQIKNQGAIELTSYTQR